MILKEQNVDWRAHRIWPVKKYQHYDEYQKFMRVTSDRVWFLHELEEYLRDVIVYCSRYGSFVWKSERTVRSKKGKDFSYDETYITKKMPFSKTTNEDFESTV